MGDGAGLTDVRVLRATRLTRHHAEPSKHWKSTLASNEDIVNHPPHYTQHPSGVECIDITEHFNFCMGNAVKYIWRADQKDNPIEDLRKARWYLDREIERRLRADRAEG